MRPTQQHPVVRWTDLPCLLATTLELCSGYQRFFLSIGNVSHFDFVQYNLRWPLIESLEVSESTLVAYISTRDTSERREATGNTERSEFQVDLAYIIPRTPDILVSSFVLDFKRNFALPRLYFVSHITDFHWQ